ncbi:hypothetical protein [Schleiferilactobacillus harbinensis]|nr:hypothetical protein [Schleiferilactobacillus harbinensis]
MTEDKELQRRLIAVQHYERFAVGKWQCWFASYLEQALTKAVATDDN